jgi:prepilin-type N-terminal cleavage/methylation domain-containing protein
MKKEQSAFSLIELSIVILIIGILIAGVVSGSRIVNESNLRVAKNITQSSDVSSIKGLLMWFDATDEDTIYSGTLSSNIAGKGEDGDTVVKWRDKNPQSKEHPELIIAADTHAPAYVTKAVNNLPAIKFQSSGSGDYLTYDNMQFPNDDYSIFFVFEPFSVSLANVITINKDAKQGLMLELQTDGKIRHLHRYPFSDVDTGDSLITSTNSYIAHQPNLYSFIRNGSASKTRIWVDNSLKSEETTTAEGFDPSSLEMVVGALHYSGSYQRFLNGHLSEIIVFDRALLKEDRKAVQNYLAKKYHLTLN